MISKINDEAGVGSLLLSLRSLSALLMVLMKGFDEGGEKEVVRHSHNCVILCWACVGGRD